MPNESVAIPIDDRIIMQCENAPAVDMEDLSAQLSAAWLTCVLSERNPGVVVEQSSISRIYVGTALKIWVDLKLDDAGRKAGLPSTIVVKSGFDRLPGMTFTYEILTLS